MLATDIISIASTLIGFLFTISILYVIWRRKKDRPTIYFFLILISISIWSLGYLFEMTLPDYNLKILAAKIEYIGIVILPVFWFLFSFTYTRKFRRNLKPSFVILFFLIPIITLLLVFTNEFHHLIWQSVKFSKIGDLEILTPSYGYWFWVHAIYSYIIFIAGSLSLLQETFFYPEIHRKKAVLLASAAIIPIVSNIIYLSRVFAFDFTPISFSISVFLLFLGIYRLKLMHIIPIARNEIVEGMRDAVSVFDEENRVIDLNRSAEKLLSLKRDEAIGKKAFEILVDCDKILDLLYKEDGRKTCKKSNRFYEVSTTTLRDKKGEKIGKMMVIRDVTDIKSYEMELKRLNKNLEKEVKRRTEEIEKLLKQKDEFISQLGHDLKTPLTPILSLLPLVRERVHDEDTKRLIDISLRNARYMKNLVVDTLNLAKLNMPNVKFSIKDVRLSDIVDESIRDNEHIIKKKNIRPINRVDKDIFVKADRLRLKEVFTNLISNSIKYTPEGGKIEFLAKPNGNEVIIEVKDNGTGLEGDQKYRIFDEFYKVDESRHNVESSGLGLTICKRIVEKHGGRIWAESEGLGKGTSIYFTLPISDNNGEEENIGG